MATLFLLALPRVEPESGVTTLSLLPPPGLVRTLLPVIGMGAAYNYLFGAYDTVWSLFMVYAGASVFQVGLSFALFALPVALLSGAAGRISDRFGARPTVAVTLATSGVFALGYVFVRNVPALIGMGVVEGSLTTGGQPALQAEVSRLAPLGQQGGTQGVYRTAMVGAQIVGALVGGFLFTVWPGWAFVSMAAACGLSLLAVPFGRRPAVRSPS